MAGRVKKTTTGKVSVNALKAEAEKKVEDKVEKVDAEVKAAPAKKTASARKTTATKKTEVSNRKSAVQCDMVIQFQGKEYTKEELEKIANDVWVYDCERKASEIESISMYVKPEESKVYCVFNGEIPVSFDI